MLNSSGAAKSNRSYWAQAQMVRTYLWHISLPSAATLYCSLAGKVNRGKQSGGGPFSWSIVFTASLAFKLDSCMILLGFKMGCTEKLWSHCANKHFSTLPVFGARNIWRFTSQCVQIYFLFSFLFSQYICTLGFCVLAQRRTCWWIYWPIVQHFSV